MKIAVVGGSGNVGSRLARQLCLSGNNVVLASRNPQDAKTLDAVAKVKDGANGTASAASFAEATADADCVIVATPGYPTAAEWKKVVEPWAGYGGVVLDATNPLTPWPALDISTDKNTSAAEELQKVLPSAKVYKAFNTLGAELMSNPEIGGKPITMMYAGDKEETTKELAGKVIAAVGFSPVWVGELRYSRNLESMAELWIHMAIKYGWRRDGFAFDIVKA